MWKNKLIQYNRILSSKTLSRLNLDIYRVDVTSGCYSVYM